MLSQPERVLLYQRAFSNLCPSCLRTTLWKEGKKPRFPVYVQSERELYAGLRSWRFKHLLSPRVLSPPVILWHLVAEPCPRISCIRIHLCFKNCPCNGAFAVSSPDTLMIPLLDGVHHLPHLGKSKEKSILLNEGFLGSKKASWD